MVLVNQCTFAGNLGADPEKKYTQDGRAVCRFRFAVSNRIKNRETNEWEDDTMWVSVTGFGPSAERAVDQLKKGSRVLVMGRLDTPNLYTRQDGTQAIGVSMVGATIVPLDRGADIEDGEEETRPAPAPAQQSRPAPRQAAQPAARPAARVPARQTAVVDEETPDLQDLPF